MYINKYILLFILPLTLLHAEKVNFVIQKLKENAYEIRIKPQKTKLKQIYAEGINMLITPDTRTLIITGPIPKKFGKIQSQSPSSLAAFRKAEAKLDQAIHSKIIDFMVYDEKNRSNNVINVTVELESPTTFNKAYRDLYNDVRTFSKELAEEQRQRSKPPVSILDRLKALIWRTKPEEINPEIEPIDMLPDLAPQQWFFQQHPKKTLATGTALTGVAAYLYYKSKQGQ